MSQKDTTWTKLFVGGLPYHTTDKTLRKDQHGTNIPVTHTNTSKAAKYDDFWASSRPFTYPSGKTRLLSVRNYCCSVYSRLEIKIIENKNYISDGKK